MKKTHMIDGVEVLFTTRTYAGRQTYCWAHVFVATKTSADWEPIGDPYPAKHYPRKALREDLRLWKQRQTPQNTILRST